MLGLLQGQQHTQQLLDRSLIRVVPRPLLPCICSYVPFICASFPSIVVVITKASLIQGWTHSYKTASLCHATFTCSLSALACYIHVSLCVRATICAVPLMLSYYCCSSHASASKRYMFGSSYRVVRTLNDSSNILVQSLTTLLISSIPNVMALARCSLTSRGVEGYAFNHSSAIWRFSSRWSLAILAHSALLLLTSRCAPLLVLLLGWPA